MAELKVGAKAPEFSRPDQDGKPRTLKEFRGKNVVLYFYPKDDTPGCTVEACNFRDDHSALQKAGAVVLGVSPDGAKSHQKFISKYALPFTLLSDEDHSLADAYGAWGEKSMYGRRYMGIVRSTVLIDPDGKVKAIWPKVKVAEHAAEVLSALGAEASPKNAAAKPAAKKAVAGKPAASKFGASKPAVSKPAVSKPAVSKPAMKKPAMKKPAMKKSTAAEKSARR